MPIRSLASVLIQCGFNVVIKPIEQWRERFEETCTHREFRSVSNLVNHLNSDRSLFLKSDVAPQVTSRMWRLLTQLGVSCPASDVRLLEKYSQHLNPQAHPNLPTWLGTKSQFSQINLDHQPIGQP
jgi:hypothetical protein